MALAVLSGMLTSVPAIAQAARPVPSEFSLPRRVVAIGGGTGLPVVLRGLSQIAEQHPVPEDWLTAIVTVTDDGGSSGRLRQTLGMLPPGDIRNCLDAMARRPTVVGGVLQQRVECGDKIAHPIGNLLIAALAGVERDFLRAIDTMRALLGVPGRVLPATLENVHLSASFDDGSQVRGESAIAARRGRIRRLTLERPVRPVPDVVEALVNADLIVVGPGSLYTSLLPNLIVDGVANTMSAVRATRVYVANLMTEPGETDGYSLADHLTAIREHTGHELFDYVLVNTSPLDEAQLRRYAAGGSVPVQLSDHTPWTDRARVVAAELTAPSATGEVKHDPAALAYALLALSASRSGC